ncbi:MAG: Gfo/Idh/MocA family oxidoreductase [Verrucomicrobia bacterium]|nr:Gfo/Idh/MocA family oxidoreductase [Verrucomicrobiota bacterium]
MAKKIKDRVRLAIIGAGGISAAHAKGINTHQDKITCVALCDVSDKNLAQRSEQLGGVTGQFKDWKKMFAAMADDIDAVDICLPHHLHAQAILDAAAAGKHILCEKPMCMSLAEADRIAAAVTKSGITYMSAHNQLFMPVVQEAKKRIDDGAIGKLMWLRSQDCFLAGVDGFRGTWRSKVKSQGGGELIDTGYHPSYRLLHLAGSSAVGVRGSMGRFVQPIEGEDTASVQVRFANGVLGEILTSWAFGNPFGSHQIHAIGDKGQLFGSQNELYYLPAGFAQPAKQSLPSVDTFTAQMGHFADCLRDGKRPPHSVAEGRAVLEIILKAGADARGWQKLASKKVK